MAATDKIYYIYVIMNPNYGTETYGKYTFPHRPFYVGKGKSTRFRSTLCTERIGNKHKANTIRKLINEGNPPIVWVCKKNLDEETAFKYEKKLIRIIGRRDLKFGPLTNMTDGGQGISGIIIESWIHRLSDREYQRYSDKLSKSIRLHHQSMSIRDRRIRADAIADGLAKLSNSDWQSLIDRRTNSIRKYYAKNGHKPEIYAARIAGTRRWLENASPEHIRKINKSRSEKSKAWHASLSDKERRRFQKIYADTRSAFWQRKTIKERKAIGSKIGRTKRELFWESIPVDFLTLDKQLKLQNRHELGEVYGVPYYVISKWHKTLSLGKHAYIEGRGRANA